MKKGGGGEEGGEEGDKLHRLKSKQKVDTSNKDMTPKQLMSMMSKMGNKLNKESAGGEVLAVI